MTPVLSAEELNAFLLEVFPEAEVGGDDYRVEEIAPGTVLVRQKTGTAHLRPGGTVSGPTIFTLCDVTAYAVVLGHIGRQALAVTTNLNLNFVRKAEPGELVCRGTILKLGKQLVVFEASVSSAGVLVAHATGTYAIPPRKD